MTAVFNGREHCGNIERRDGAFVAISAAGKSLGVYATQKEGVAAVMQHATALRRSTRGSKYYGTNNSSPRSPATAGAR
jgi:hypothetical protein